ncbi:MAG: TlpA family protein disulfide reductase, partial [Bacteroidales bacterium]|nr:TlpA family protein disulfide reductase [Bacteroidales bacterium]
MEVIRRSQRPLASLVLCLFPITNLSVSLCVTALLSLFSTPLSSQTSLPDMFAKGLDGKEVKLTDILTGEKPVVISFWATWCNPCVEELEAVSEKFESWQKEIDFTYVAISTDDVRSTSRVRSFVSGREWPFTVLIDANQEIMKAMNISSIPFTMILSKDGVVRYSHSGYIPGDEKTLFR